MNHGQLTFTQLLQRLPLPTLRRCVARYAGELLYSRRIVGWEVHDRSHVEHTAYLVCQHGHAFGQRPAAHMSHRSAREPVRASRPVR